MGLKKYLVNRREVLQHLLKHDLFDGKENTEKRKQRLKTDLAEIDKALLILFGVGMQSELLLCGVCDEATMHDTTNDKELICLVCNNLAKE